jgi:hypothetical protein
VYIGIAEEIRNNKNYEYNKIFKFLGAESYIIDESKDSNVRTYKKPIKTNDAKILYNIYKPHNENLYKILGRKIDIWEDYYKKLN